MAQKNPEVVKINDETDFDYNVQHSDDAIKLLERLGERQHGNPAYNDNQAVDFWVLKNGVTVITRKNLEVYKAAFELVGVEDFVKFHWKSSPYLVDGFKRDRTRDYFNNLFDHVEKTK